MRLLFTFAGGSGHLEPLVPIPRAAETAGHTVAFVARPWMAPRAETLGFAAFAAGSDAGFTPRRLPLAPLDLDSDRRAVGDHFVRRIGRERAVGEATAGVLEQPSYRRNATRVHDEIAALPGPDHVVTLLEGLAAPGHDGVSP